MSELEPVMSIDHLGFSYQRDRIVLDDISLAIGPGKLHVLLGPNAAGKSTLLKLMLGLLQPGSGKIRMGGRAVHRLSAAGRAAWISHVPQRSSATFAFEVRQVVTMSRYLTTENPAAIESALSACELIELQRRPFTELSVGQQQRVLLARAMAQSTGQGRLMLLDEPTSAMDLAHVHQTLRILKQITAAGVAVVIVLQDLNLAARYADHVFLMHQGKLAAEGPWDQVLIAPTLEPVYGVKITALRCADPALDQRPVFEIHPAPPPSPV